MKTASAAAAEDALWLPKYNPWLIGIVVAMAAFMEVLDTSIANVALPHIAGDLAASNSQSTWVLTSYLVANAIVLPISGWLVGLFGRKRFFLVCIICFTLSSVACGMAVSLPMLLVFRVLQGAFGGGLQPMAQAILADTFPPHKRGLALALYGVTAITAPIIGPVLGGWLTDNYSWRWVFYINIPVGILTVALVYLIVEDPPYLARIKNSLANFDYIGLSLLTVGIGSLQVFLDKGQELDWFGSPFITTLAISAAVCLVSLVVWEWRHEHPIVEVRLLRNRNFAVSNVMMLMLGLVMFSSAVLMPQFMQTLMGYTAEQSGLVMTGGAIVMLFMMGLVGPLTTQLQARSMAAFGWLTMAIGMYLSIRGMDLQLDFGSASILRVFQSVPLPFLFVPISLVAYVGLPKEKNNAASGITNFMRNIGMSIGTSVVSTVVARRAQFHQSILVQHTGSAQFRNSAMGLSMQLHSAGLGMHKAQTQAVGRLYLAIQAQAMALSYIDVYWMLTIVSAVLFLLSFALAKNDPGKGESVPMH